MIGKVTAEKTRGGVLITIEMGEEKETTKLVLTNDELRYLSDAANGIAQQASITLSSFGEHEKVLRLGVI